MRGRKKAPVVEVVGEKSPTIHHSAPLDVEIDIVPAQPDNSRRFCYIGQCASGFIVMLGHTFKENVPVRIKDAGIAEKLAKHSHFREVV